MWRILKSQKVSKHVGCFIWSMQDGGRDGVVIKIIRFMLPHGDSKAPAPVTYDSVTFEGESWHTTKQDAGLTNTSGLEKWGREKDYGVVFHVLPMSSSPQFILPWECAFTNMRRIKWWENKRRDKTAATIEICSEFDGLFNTLNCVLGKIQ